jgi:hypothetical protein
MPNPFDPNTSVNIPVALLGGAAFIFGGWYHLRRAREICERIAAGVRGVPFLAQYYRSRGCYLTMRAGGVLCIAIGLFLLSVALWHLAV